MNKTSISLFLVFRLFIKKIFNDLFLAIFTFTFIIHSQIVLADNITLVVPENSIPSSYVKNGKQTGTLIDVINEAFSRTEHTIDIIQMPWARCIQEVKNGNVDGVFSIFLTDERKKFLTYTDEVLITEV